MTKLDYQLLAQNIKNWGLQIGFQQIGITDTNLKNYEDNFLTWLKNKFHGSMQYMEAHGEKRYKPQQLHEGTIRIISARLNYLPPNTKIQQVLQDKSLGYISRYALGRDYHKLMRKRLNLLCKKICNEIGHFGFRAFSDSAPVLEKPLAEKAGLGWIGKNTNLINSKAGSWFFLGEIFTDLPLPLDIPATNHCGSCSACIDICPTDAIIGPYKLDARKCISYLTIELRDAIPVEFRKKIGNRIYGCDDCQLICPWNKFSKFTTEKDFHPRNNLSALKLIELFSWTAEEFYKKTEGSAIRRIGHECWLRNIAVAMGNAPTTPNIVLSLKSRLKHPSNLVKEHVIWALDQHNEDLLKL